MIKFVSPVLFAAAITIALPALAASIAKPIAFEHAGVHYVGTVTDRTDGSQQISGREIESGHAFNLVVARGRVDGVYDGQTVSYDAPSAKRAGNAEIADAATGQ